MSTVSLSIWVGWLPWPTVRQSGATRRKVRSDATGELTIQNASPDAIDAMFLLRVHGPGGKLVSLGGLGANDERSGVVIPEGGKEHDLDLFVADTKQVLKVALVADGLFEDEAQATQATEQAGSLQPQTAA